MTPHTAELVTASHPRGALAASLCPSLGGELAGLTLAQGKTSVELLYRGNDFSPVDSGFPGRAPWLWPAAGRCYIDRDAARIDQPDFDRDACTWQCNGTVLPMRHHGFAKDMAWRIEPTDDDARSALTINSNGEHHDIYPFDFALRTDARAAPCAGRRAPSRAQIERRRAATGEPGDPNYLTLGEVPRLGPWDELAWKLDGVQEGVYRKLRLGKYGMEARLDLHRLTVREAREEIWRFVGDCVRLELRTVLISHGRGDRSETPGRLKSYVAHWLWQLEEVLAYHSAQREHGGYGAVYVLLRKSERKRQDNRERHSRRPS